MSAKRFVLIGILFLLVAANAWSRLAGNDGEDRRSSRRAESDAPTGAAARAAVRSDLPSTAGRKENEILPLPPEADLPPPRRNLFAYADLPPTPPKPVAPPGPPPPPPKSPEEIAAEQARARLSSFRFEGAMSRGSERLLMLSRGEEVLAAISGGEVVKGVRARESGASSVELEDEATRVKVTLGLKGGN